MHKNKNMDSLPPGILFSLILLLQVLLVSSQCGVCPLFLKSSYKASVPENTTIDTVVVTVTAFNSYGDQISYGITYLGSNLPFEVHAVTGAIRVISQLDYLLQDEYEFTVQANVGGFQASASVVISILDSPDPLKPVVCYPLFPEIKIIQLSENEIIMEENSTQWINCTISNEPSQHILYHFSDPAPPISINNGFVQVAEGLDYENQSSYSLTATFTDTADNPLIGNYTIKLLVLPINEYAPAFNNIPGLVYHVSELASIGTLVGQPVATDKDGGIDGNVMYSIAGGNGSDAFVINAITGELYNSIELDREEQSGYDLIIVAYDTPANSTHSLSSSATVIISITDENDNAPIFDEATYFVEVPEDQAPLSAVSTLHCTDSDTGVNSAVTYHLDGQNDHFAIDSISGVISVVNQLDYESSLIHHKLVVQCVDGGDLQLTGEVLVMVDVININEYDPKIEVTIFTVEENAMPGTIMGIVNVTDGDSGFAGEAVYELVYSSDCPNVLALNEITGEIFVTGAIDYDHPIKGGILKCLVSVHDQQEPIRTVNATISIIITNTNDNPPSCVPSVAAVTVPEDTASGAVVALISCTDLDNDALVYNIIEQSSDYFAISENNSLVLNSALDYEQNKSFVVIVSVSDGHFSSQVTFFILVAPVNEHPPTFVSDIVNCTVSEAGTVGGSVCTVLAFDNDSGIDGQISYSLNNSDTFLVNSLTGDILLRVSLDYETLSNYELTLFAEDNSITNIRLTGSTIVYISVEDYNDKAPSMAPVTFISLSENPTNNKLIASLNCTDVDTVSQKLLIVLLSASEIYRNNSASDIDNPPFYIESNALYTNGSIDYEVTQLYQLTISCSDGGEPLLSSSSIISVHVDEENEFVPYFTSPGTKLILEYSLNVEAGEVLYEFQASDDDSSSSGDISYSLSFDSLEYVPFLAIQEISGHLILLTPLTCNYGDVLEYTVVASDRGKPQLSADVGVTISIIDCELAQPIADTTIYTTALPETAIQGTVVTQVLCTSPTPHLLPDTATIHYTIVNNATSWLDINTLTGEVLVKEALDYETEPVIVLDIQCYYSHDSLYNALLTVYINLLPQNEHTPTFSQPHYSLTLSEDTTPGCIISTIIATDSDYGRDGDIRYSLSGNGPFMLHPQTAELHLIDYLDREVETMYHLTVTAQDNPVNVTHTRTSFVTVNVSISDINDNMPYCTPLVYYSTIKPTTAVGTLLYMLNCTDPDSGENGTLQYSIGSTGSTSWPVAVDTISGSVHISKVLAEDDPLSYTVPIRVRDGGREGLSVVVYVVVEVDVTTKDVVVFDASLLSVAENEGWSNNVTVSIKDMWSLLWTTEIEDIFKVAIVNSTSSYCAIQPVQCSLLGACENGTNSDSSYGCLSYDVFNVSNVVVHPTLTETTVGGTTVLELSIYVLLPNGAIKSPFRETEYVIPKGTLGIIVKDNNDLIGAMVRDTVSNFLMILNKGWKQACIALIVILTVLLMTGTITFTAIQMHKWYLWKRDRVVIYNRNKLQPSDKEDHHQQQQQEEVQTTSFARCSYSVTPPSMLSTRHTPDAQSLVNMSEDSSSGRSSANHHWCHTHSLLHKLESVADQSDNNADNSYNHPHAVEHNDDN